MTEIANSTMFTNGRLSSGPSDLIQQAFQGVDDEEDHQNFVAYIESDENGSQTLRLSPEAAAQFGFNVNIEGGISGEVTFLQNDGEVVSEVQPQVNAEDVSNVDCTRFSEWPVQNMNQADTFQQNTSEPILSINTMDSSSTENCTQDSSRLLENSNDLMQVDSVLQQANIATFENSQISSPENCMQYALVENQSSQPQSFVTVTNPQGQLIQGLPMMIPSSQYSLKQIQPLQKPTKNVRILPSTSKISTPASNVHSITNGTTSNTVLFSNGTLLNTMSPQVIKALPISTQFLNASDFLSGSCDISNQPVNVSMSDSIPNTTNTIAPNLLSNQLSQILKINPGSLQSGNLQQILNSVMKSTNSQHMTLKSTPVFTTSTLKTPLNTSLRKPVQIASPSVRVNTAQAKNFALKSNPKVVLQNLQSTLKTTTNPTSVLRTTSSVSVLKQQPKANFAKRVNMQSLNNISNNVQTLQKCISMKQGNVEKCPVAVKLQEAANQGRTVKSIKNIKSMPGVVFEKFKGSNLCTMKSSPLKSATPGSSSPSSSKSNSILATTRINPTNHSTTKASELFSKADLLKHDNTKPLGTCKNPIPIITHSQGKTFIIDDNVPSSQINHIFQKYNREQNFDQLSHENGNSKEKVVYQIVYPNDLNLVNRRAKPEYQLTNSIPKRPAKRGRPKKNTTRPQVLPAKSVSEEEKEMKNDRKKVIARTRSGRLSRPPKHMVRDYKHLHPIDFTQPDLDDSDGGYSDYNTNGEVPEDEESPKELLAGLEVRKRKVSKEYICPTCNKAYLGREKMILHFEKNPSHGSIDQLPPPKPKAELNQVSLDALKPKGKKRGPWGTPEEKSARRQEKLQSAIAVCDKNEVCNIAAKPVLEAMSLYDLMVLKSENNVISFMGELKDLMIKVREKSGIMLTVARDEDRNSDDIVDLNDDLLCDALGLNPGLYKINNNAFGKEESSGDDEPPMKKGKPECVEEEQNQVEERTSSGFSDGSDTSSNCPDVLTALTLRPRNSSPTDEPCKLSGSKLVISNPEIQNELRVNNGFRKIDISTNNASFQKLEAPIVEEGEQAFIKLQSTVKRFVKLENGMVGSYQNQNDDSFEGIQSFETASENFHNSGESGSNIFEGLENLAHLGMLNGTEQSHMTEQIEQIVNDKLDDMIPGDLLGNNLLSNSSMTPDISFAFNSTLTEEYTFRNIRS